MASDGEDFELYAGETKEVTITVTDADGDAVPLTGATITWGAYDRTGARTVRVTKSGADITISSNTFMFTLDPADTESLSPGVYAHEARVVDADDNEAVVTTGYMTVERSLT